MNMSFSRLPLGLLLAALLSAGCRATGAHSPTLDVVGSYFPAWMVCIVIGIGLTVVARQVLILIKLNDHLHPAPLVYLAMMVLGTLAVWLIEFKN